MRNSILACHNSIFFCDHTWDSRPTLRSDNIFQKLILSTPNRPLTCVSAIKQPFTMRINSARKESIKITKFSINFRISNHLSELAGPNSFGDPLKLGTYDCKSLQKWSITLITAKVIFKVDSVYKIEMQMTRNLRGSKLYLTYLWHESWTHRREART